MRVQNSLGCEGFVVGFDLHSQIYDYLYGWKGWIISTVHCMDFYHVGASKHFSCLNGAYRET